VNYDLLEKTFNKFGIVGLIKKAFYKLIIDNNVEESIKTFI